MPTVGRIGAERCRFLIVGFFTTFLGIFVSAIGTLLAPFAASAAPDRRNHSATIGTLMLTTHVSKLIAFGFLGFATGPFLPLAAAMVIARVGKVALSRTPEARFRIMLQFVLTAMASRLIWTAAHGAGYG